MTDKRMKNDLDLLIEYLQNEYNALKLAMDKCVEEWDFEGAIRSRDSIYQIRGMLYRLKHFKDPNYKERENLEKQISELEERLNKEFFNKDFISEKSKVKLESNLKNNIRRRIDQNLDKLIEFNNEVPQQNDEDTLLQILHELETGNLNSMEIELKKDVVYLDVDVIDNVCKLKIRVEDWEDFATQTKNRILSGIRKLGFEMDSCSKRIEDYRSFDKYNLLQELAAINYEIFGFFKNKGLDLKVK